MDIFGTLTSKWKGIPIWLIAALGVGGLVFWMKRRQASGASGSTAAAANQANSNMVSASQLANMFQVAGLMPYQGGNTYVNQVNQPPVVPIPPVNGVVPPFNASGIHVMPTWGNTPLFGGPHMPVNLIPGTGVGVVSRATGSFIGIPPKRTVMA